MAKQILKDALIEIDGVDLSSLFSEIAVDSEKDVHDVTGFGAENKEKAIGLGDATITGTAFQDFDAASLNATMWPLHTAGEPFPIKVRAKKGQPVSATNPEFRMQAVAPNYSPISGSVGEPSTTELTFENASQDGLTMHTTPEASGSGSGSGSGA